jgi:hypothetical protein
MKLLFTAALISLFATGSIAQDQAFEEGLTPEQRLGQSQAQVCIDLAKFAEGMVDARQSLPTYREIFDGYRTVAEPASITGRTVDYAARMISAKQLISDPQAIDFWKIEVFRMTIQQCSFYTSQGY